MARRRCLAHCGRENHRRSIGTQISSWSTQGFCGRGFCCQKTYSYMRKPILHSVKHFVRLLYKIRLFPVAAKALLHRYRVPVICLPSRKRLGGSGPTSMLARDPGVHQTGNAVALELSCTFAQCHLSSPVCNLFMDGKALPHLHLRAHPTVPGFPNAIDLKTPA